MIYKYVSESKYEPIFSEDATNGDVIKAMFPDAEWHSAMGQTTIFVPKTAIYNTEVLRVSTDWWNAKYKGGD